MTMKKKSSKVVRIILIAVACWIAFLTIEGVRLIGSTDPGKYPLIRLGGTQAQDVCAEYQSMGFTQYYGLAEGDEFVFGEFRILSVAIARW